MDIYTLFMLLAVAINLLLSTKQQNKRKKTYCFIMGLLLFLIAALRKSTVGIDSARYAEIFSEMKLIQITDLLNSQLEVGFYLLLKMLSLISDNYSIMFAVVAGIYAYAISRFIYKYSSSAMVSFIMLIPMMYFAFTLTGLRQTVALSLTLISIDFIVQKRLIPFTSLLILASTFHRSALLFFPAYFLNREEIKKWHIMLLVIIAPIVYFSRRSLILIVQLFLYSDYKIAGIGEEVSSWAMLLVYVLILLVTGLFKPYISKKNKNFPLFYLMLYTGMCIQMFVPLQPNIFRVGMYYNITSILLVPEILAVPKDKSLRLIVYMVFLLLMAIEYYMFTFYAANANPYSFFWQ